LKIAFFSDIHGNLPALKTALNNAGKVDGYIILGDVVNYGPWSNECVQLLDSLSNCTKIRGNHEDYFIQGECNCDNFLAIEFFKHCYKRFSEHSLIIKYKTKIEFENFICTHTIDDEYIFPDTEIKLNNNYIIGHSHKQFIINHNGFSLINPGSLGQNRQFINEINYMIYDTRLKKTEFKSTLYDVNIVLERMKKLNYPDICINYYNSKPRK
tara:strand:- start:269 stop:904 length:636 start_codon:yes stop_codon:yes gene_type:complete